MTEDTLHKIRDIKLIIARLERELAASQKNTGLGAFLGAGHASQLARIGERDRKRIEGKLEVQRARLAALEAGAPPENKTAEADAPAADKPKKRSTKKAS